MNHILVVDDEPLMRTWLSKSIPKHSTCFDVPNTAQDGIEAIDYLKQAAYDVVITDIKMPGMDGLNLAKFIQENYPDTVVIIISGFNDFAYARKAIQYGVKDYLLKPLVDDDLIKLLNDISKRLQKHTPTLLANPTEEERSNPRAMLFRAILEDDSDGIYVGYYIQNWSTGTKAAMYRFEAEDKDSGAPVYIEFNDHMIEPAAAEHFHIRMSNESFDAIVNPENSWPTFFPADMTGEEICEHMEGHDHDEDEDHEHEEGEEHEHEEEKDEHVWLSLKNAEVLVNAISKSLQELDPDNKDTYAANAAAYIEKLSALDGEYQAAVDAATYKTVLFGDRFPFRYLVDDYGLRYYAAFVGCSAETEASFETVSFLAKKVDELKLPCVLTIEGAQHKIAETIVQNTAEKNQKVLTMDSLQSTTSKDVANGTTYLSVMEKNLSVLKEALG